MGLGTFEGETASEITQKFCEAHDAKDLRDFWAQSHYFAMEIEVWKVLENGSIEWLADFPSPPSVEAPPLNAWGTVLAEA